MTMTFPLLNRSRAVLWLMTGAAKVEMLHKLRAGDRTIPAGRIEVQQQIVLADKAAVGE